MTGCNGCERGANPARATPAITSVLPVSCVDNPHFEVFPLLFTITGGPRCIIAFITHSADIRHILDHFGVELEPPHIAPARGPPLWEGCVRGSFLCRMQLNFLPV